MKSIFLVFLGDRFLSAHETENGAREAVVFLMDGDDRFEQINPRRWHILDGHDHPHMPNGPVVRLEIEERNLLP